MLQYDGAFLVVRALRARKRRGGASYAKPLRRPRRGVHLIGKYCYAAQARKRAPSFFPRIRLAPRMVTARKTMAHTPRAEAMYWPTPMSWKSS